MDKVIATKIISAANMAPSGGNTQPWSFFVDGDTITIQAHPELDHKVLNFRKRGTLFAVGAAIENSVVAGSAEGLAMSLEKVDIENMSFVMKFVQKGEKEDKLLGAITERHSNRKPYLSQDVPDELFSDIFSQINQNSCEVKYVRGDSITPVAQSLANDIVLNLGNKTLHSLLFQEVLWKEEDQKNRGGLYVKTMEAIGPKATAMKLISHWPIAKIFKKIGIVKKIYGESVATISSSAAIGAIAVDNDDRAFLDAGRALQKIWLRATQKRLSMQIVAAVAFLWQQLTYGTADFLDDKERKIITDAYQHIQTSFGFSKPVVAIAFRIGHAEKPLATSYKRPPNITWK